MRRVMISCALILVSPFVYSQVFNEISKSAGIDYAQVFEQLMGGGIAFFDANNDGFDDLYLTGGILSDKLYLNQKDGTFLDVSDFALPNVFEGITTTGVTTGDIDNDGTREIVVTVFDGPNLLLQQQADGNYINIAVEANLTESTVSMAASFGDVNLDGYLDLYIANYMIEQQFQFNEKNEVIGFDPICESDLFYLNNGDNTFTEVSNLYGTNLEGCALAVTFSDIDGDSDQDIIIANDFGEWHLPNSLFRNNLPMETFDDIGVESNMNAQMYGMGIAKGDYDRDGYVDYYITNIGRNRLFNNKGEGIFEDETTASQVEDIYESDLFATGWGTAFADVDNDGWLDLYVSNGEIPSVDFITNNISNPNRLFLNNGDGTFTEVGDEANVNDDGRGRGMAISDFDRDGDVDILAAIVKPVESDNGHVLLYENQTITSNHWINVKLEGSSINRDAFGSKVTVFVNGKGMIREIDGGSSHSSQNSSVLHFGLGPQAVIDSLVIDWNGAPKQLVTQVNVDEIYGIKQDTAQFLIPSNFCSNQSSIVKLIGMLAENEYNLIDLSSNLPVSKEVSGDTLLFAIDEIDVDRQYQLLVKNNEQQYFYKLGDVLSKYSSAVIPVIEKLEGQLLTKANGISYQWKLDGVSLPAANSAVLASEDGTYEVQVVYNEGCDLVSEPFTLLVTSLENGKNPPSYTIYPNPVNHRISIVYDQKNKVRTHLQIHDARGDLQFSKLATISKGNGLTINLSSLSKGVYFLSLREKSEVRRFKIIKQ